MVAVSLFLALIAIGLGFLLVKAIGQNRALWHEFKAIRRSLPVLLRDALVLWSPLALVIIVLAFAANRMSAASVALTYRLTTLDEFCRVENVAGRVVIPCTGMEGVLAHDAVKRAGASADLDEYVSAQFRAARLRLLGWSADDWRRAAANRTVLRWSLTAPGAFGLASAPEDDAEMVRLKQELTELLHTPTPPARDVLDIVRFVTERDARLRRMRELTAQVIARREQVNRDAYAGLTREAQGRLWLRNRLSHLLLQASRRPDAATESALTKLQTSPASAADALPIVRRGVVSTLARNEAVAAEILMREARTPKGSASLYLALPMTRRCTIASPDPNLRRWTSDFENDPADSDSFIESNSGTFPCFDLVSPPGTTTLTSLGLRESVRRSIGRWHDDAVRTSFRRLGKLSLAASAVARDTRTATHELAQAIPHGIQLGRSDCGWLHPGNCAANAAREAAEESMAAALAEAIARYERRADSSVGAAASSFEQRIGERLLTLDAQLDDMRAGAEAYAGRLFLLHDLLRLVGWLALALVVIKSFLYALALELFHSDEEMAIGFAAANPVEGEYRSGRKLTIDREFPHPMITRKQLSNTDHNLCLAPWPWSSPLARILRGRYFIFTKGRFLADAESPAEAGAAPRGMVASASGGMSIVEWKIQPGEEVIFRYQDFYGASENVRLGSEISFRLSTLLLGRIVFRVARCLGNEGRLLLKASVEEIDQEDIRAVPPERMIAWNRHAQFTIHSGRTLWTTLLNGYTLVRKERQDGRSGRIVVSSEDIGSNFGSIRFVKRIFTAIF